MRSLPDDSAVADSIVVKDFNQDTHLDLLVGTDNGKLILYRGRAAWWDFDPPTFVSVSLPSASQIFSLAAADFNTDGKQDLALGISVTGAPGPRVYTMLGNGDGTFGSGSPCGPSCSGAGRIRVADFDGNTTLDLICVADASIAVIWGSGTGSFANWVVVSSGLSVDIADIDGDGDTDAVVSPPPAAPAHILRNNGLGVFTPEPLGFNITWDRSYTFGEMNGDDRPDLVFVVSDGCINGDADELVCVALNDGLGHFPAFVPYSVSGHPDDTCVDWDPLPVDLDGDGRCEVVIGRKGTWWGSGSFRDQVLVYRNAGNGTLEDPPPVYHTPSTTSNVYLALLATADLDQDGRLDLVRAVRHNMSLLLNDGSGGFLTAHGTPMGPELSGGGPEYGPMTNLKYVTPGDVNADGRFDLMGVREGTWGSPGNPNYLAFLECTVMLQDTQGAFTSLVSVPLPEKFTTDLEVADFDHDGKLDMAVTTSSETEPCGGDGVRVAFGNGDGTFGSWAIFHIAGKSPADVAAGDLNGDLLPDLAISEFSGSNCPSTPQGPRGISVLLNNGDRTFAPAAQYNFGSQSDFVTIADLDGDTHPDIGATWRAGGASGVRILLNNGNGIFTLLSPPNNYNSAGASRVTFADVNGDSRPDMLVTFSFDSQPTSGGVGVALNNGDGTFQFLGQLDPFTDYALQHVATGDFDEDGNTDIAIAVAASAGGTINVHLGNGDGTFDALIVYGGGPYVGPSDPGKGVHVIVADFDNDGRPDLGSPLGCSPDWDRPDYVGFARLYNRMCSTCYPDCNGDGSLTVADFGCFQTKFVAGDPYADCNGAGGLTVADFGCFQTQFVAGCP